jgi:hypothetical protein
MPDTGRCAVCDRHYELTVKKYDGKRRPRVHYGYDGERCPGCEQPAQPRTSQRKTRSNGDNGAAILGAIRDYISREGMPPTVRDISDLTGQSASCVYYNLQRLHDAGALVLRKGVSRGIIIKEGVAA